MKGESMVTKSLTEKQADQLRDIVAGYGNLKNFHRTLNSTMSIQTLYNIIDRKRGKEQYVNEIIRALELKLA